MNETRSTSRSELRFEATLRSVGVETVYVGRPGAGRSGPFGNPVVLGKTCSVCNTRHPRPGDTLRCFRVYLEHRIKSDADFRDAVRGLHGKTLLCFCAAGDPCHGDVLVEVADRLAQEP